MVTNIMEYLNKLVNLLGGVNILFILALAIELVFVLFFLIKSLFSYESSLNRALDKLNYWLFQKKMVTEENIKELDALFRHKAPRRVCYYWRQYILFREGAPSTYLSTENLVDNPLKTSSYNSNIKNLGLFTTVWAFVVAMFFMLGTNDTTYLMGRHVATTILVVVLVYLIGVIFMVYMRARKNSILNSLYQNVALFGRFMDNACISLPSYIDYQILFTPEEIEKGQPVLREFLDYKARKEKEEFDKAKEEKNDYVKYDFSVTGIDGSIVLDRAMKESEAFLKQKEKILVQIAQLDAELDSRRKNFDNTQRDYQTKIQASKENVNRLRQMQEETTNRIESNFYRKQQTQEISKQEQFEQEFEQQRTKYLLEKKECEDEIARLNNELDAKLKDVQNIMLGEYQTFFNKFCTSAEKIVNDVFSSKIEALKEENEQDKQRITELEIQLKSVPQGVYDADAQEQNAQAEEGKYDEQGNYRFADGSYYDTEGLFHDVKGDVYTQDGVLVSKHEEEKQVVNLDELNEYDYLTDVSQKGDIYKVAENVIKDIDDNVEVINNTETTEILPSDEPVEENKVAEENEVVENNQPVEEKKEDAKVVSADFEDFELPEEPQEEKAEEPVKEEKQEETKPRKKAGRPRKIVQNEEPKIEKKRGRPKKQVDETQPTEKRKVGRPKKIVNKEEPAVKRGRGRPKKQIDSILEINKKLSAEEAKLNEMRATLNEELEKAMSDIDSTTVDDKQKRRDELIQEIENLQSEAQAAMTSNTSEARIEEINARLEALLDEVKKLN